MNPTNHNHISIAIVAFYSVLFGGCKDNGIAPVSTKMVVVSGQVRLTDENPSLLSVQKGVTVTIEDKPYSATTDSLGYWVLADIPAGKYNVNISFPGYEPTKFIGFEFKRDTTVFYASLGKVPSFNVVTISALATSDSITFYGTLSNVAAYRRRVSIFFGTDSTVSIRNYRFGLGSERVGPSASAFTLSDVTSPLRINGFPSSGAQVYMAAYGLGGGSYVLDLDHGTGYETDVSSLPARGNFVMP